MIYNELDKEIIRVPKGKTINDIGLDIASADEIAEMGKPEEMKEVIVIYEEAEDKGE